MSLLALLAATSTSTPLSPFAPTEFAHTYEVGAGKPYATITAAIAASVADHNTWVGTSSQAGIQTSPHRWRRVIVHPGTYSEGALAPLGHTAIIGASGDRGDVVVTWDGASNVLVVTGRTLYVANLTLEHTDPDPEWHPIRNAGPAGDVGMQAWQHRTTVFDNVRFSADFEGAAGKSAVDTTPGAACTIVYRDCWFDTPGQPQAINMSIATPSLNPAIGQTWFINCKVTANYGWTEDPTLPNWGYTDGTHTTPASPAPVGLPDKGNQQAGGVGRVDEVYWTGGEWDIGDHITPIQGLIVAPNGHAGDNALYVIDPSLPEGIEGGPSVKITNAANLTRTLPDLDAIPITDGVSEDEWAFFGPDEAGPVTMAASDVPTTTVTVPAGRVFWLPVELPAQMIRAGGIRIETAPGASGNAVVAHALASYGNPDAIEADASGRRSSATAAVTPGQQAITLTARWYYPGYGRIWIGVVFTEETDVIGWASPAIPDLDVLYTDGWDGVTALNPTGATTLGDGEPFPAAWIINTA